MNICTLEFSGHLYRWDTSAKTHGIAITQNFSAEQPNHFGARPAQKSIMQADGFVGHTEQGGACNVNEIRLNPHCNGTHTETVSHVLNQLIAPHEVIDGQILLAAVITVQAEAISTEDSYTPALEADDLVINGAQLREKLKRIPDHVQALIIRTLPNSSSKKSRVYNSDEQPPFFTHEAIKLISQRMDLEHLLVDMPSIDRMYDDGMLSNHRIFWNIEPGCVDIAGHHNTNRTITEMIYVPDKINDGLYGLNLQVPALNLDAVPSNPTLLEIEAI